MCGIAGLIHRGKSSNVGSELQGMLQALKHRGEDSTGYALYGDTDGKNFIMRFKVGENVGEGSSSIMEDVSVYDERKKVNPKGICLSNGPGDPEPCDYAIEKIKKFLEDKIPIFGICLGHQLLGLASGAQTFKMKFGHHGANHPVLSLRDGQVLITSQNHGFAVDEETLPKDLVATHRSLFDGSLQGVQHKQYPVFGFQGHPEASPGPHDLRPLFNNFIELIEESKR